MTPPRMQPDERETKLGIAEKTVAGRYRLLRLLHGQGASEVFLAMDEMRGSQVALKLLPFGANVTEVRAEVSALRLLHVPGVARFLDEGKHEGRHFLVMDVVPGTPFPGRALGCSWAELEETVVALFEIVARVHNRGVIHCDLKPDNVLVDEDFKPCVLDFGFSSGAAMGSGHGVDEGATGTPAYAAPEQLLGAVVDARADLFSIGVMMFEALAGRPPEDTSDLSNFLDARLNRPAPKLIECVPNCPAPISRLVEQLLARDPSQRPRSAMDALATLRVEAVPTRGKELPNLGSQARFDAAWSALQSVERVEIVGKHGVGKSRFLEELGRKWQGLGGTWIAISTDCNCPNSLELHKSLLDESALLTIDDWHQLGERALGVLRAALAAVTSRSCALAISSLHGSGEPGAIHRTCLRPLGLADLYPLFAGPDRFFHLREDSAKELFARTLGLPLRIEMEVSSWVRAGIARWAGEQLLLDRKSLGKLHVGLDDSLSLGIFPDRTLALSRELQEHLVWIFLAGKAAAPWLLARALDKTMDEVGEEHAQLEAVGALSSPGDGQLSLLAMPTQLEEWKEPKRLRAHSKLASLLPRPSSARLHQLIAATEWDLVPDEARQVATKLNDAGQLADAEAALALGLAGARMGDAQESELLLLEQWSMVAMAIFTPLAIDRVLYELSRLRERCPDFKSELNHLEQLAQAALATLKGGGAQALDKVVAVASFSNPNMERWRLALCVQAARGASLEREEEVLRQISSTLGPESPQALQASYSEWMGRLHYRKDQPVQAAVYFDRAQRDAPTESLHLSALLNGASALLDASKPKEAAALADEARMLAERCRHTFFEVRSEWIGRTADYRSGRAMELDLDLIDAAGRIGVSDQEALVCLTEAAIAWRAESPLAAALAHRAALLWENQGKVWAALLAQALEAASSEFAPNMPWLRSLLLDLGTGAFNCPDLFIGAQSLALLGYCSDCRLPGLAEPAREMAMAVRAAADDQAMCFAPNARREILSTEEILAKLDILGAHRE